jgi:uncharacterized membrane protein
LNVYHGLSVAHGLHNAMITNNGYLLPSMPYNDNFTLTLIIDKAIRMTTKLSRLGLFAMGILFAGSSYAVPNTYKLTFLSGQNGGSSYVDGINNVGDVVGESYGGAGWVATVWNGNTSYPLGTLSYGISAARGINDAGQIAGYSTSQWWNGGFTTATLWNGTTPTVLYAQTARASSSYAYGINNVGQAVGESHVGFGYVATLWNGTVPTYLSPHTGGNSTATGINDVGQVVGYSYGNAGNFAIIWNGTIPTILGTPRSGSSYAYGINNAGKVVGMSSNRGNNLATLWNGTIPTYLGDGSANDINNVGQVVGKSLSIGFGYVATLWNGMTPTYLNTFLSSSNISAGWTLSNATAINDKGVIIGDAFNSKTGISEGFVLSPIPEPETYTMMFCGLGLVGFAKRRRSKSSAKA